MLIYLNLLSNDITHFAMHKGLICSTTMKCDVKSSSFQIRLKLAQNNSNLKLKLLYYIGMFACSWSRKCINKYKWGSKSHDLHINN